MKFLQLPIKVCRGAYIPYFKINVLIFCCSLFFEEYLNTQVRINKMVFEHTIDYHPSSSKLTSTKHHPTFLWTPKRLISPEYFSNIFSNLYIPPRLRKSFKLMVLRLLANKFVNLNIESVHFYSWPQAKLSPIKLRILPKQPFLKIYFSPAESGEGDYGAAKRTKVKSVRVLVTSFNKLHHLCNLYIFGFCFVVP